MYILLELVRRGSEPAKTAIFFAETSFFRVHSSATDEKKGHFSGKKSVFTLV